MQEALGSLPFCKALGHLQHRPTWRSEVKPGRAGDLSPLSSWGGDKKSAC